MVHGAVTASSRLIPGVNAGKWANNKFIPADLIFFPEKNIDCCNLEPFF